MQRYLFIVLSCALLLSSYQTIAGESIINHCSEGLVTNVIDCRCYVKPESIYISGEGIFLVDGTEMFPLSSLQVDENGLFFELSDDYFDKCPGCKKAKVFGKCKTPDCPRRGT